VDISPEVIGHLTMPEVGIVADAGAALEAIAAALGNRGGARGTDWREGLNAAWREYAVEMAAADDTGDGPHPAALTKAVAEALPEDALVVYDGGHTTFWSNDLIPVRGVRERFHEPGLAQLGFGTPYALALKAAAPERSVVNVTGDGSFGFTIQELDTARRSGLNVVVVIHNNEAWGVIREGQRKAGFEFGTSLAGTDYAAIARGFGCHGERVEHPRDFAAAFERALAAGKPAVLDCRVAFVPHPSFQHFGAIGRATG